MPLTTNNYNNEENVELWKEKGKWCYERIIKSLSRNMQGLWPHRNDDSMHRTCTGPSTEMGKWTWAPTPNQEAISNWQWLTKENYLFEGVSLGTQTTLKAGPMPITGGHTTLSLQHSQKFIFVSLGFVWAFRLTGLLIIYCGPQCHVLWPSCVCCVSMCMCFSFCFFGFCLFFCFFYSFGFLFACFLKREKEAWK